MKKGKRSMNPLSHALKPPYIQGYYPVPQSRSAGAPETLTFRDVIKSRVWLMGRIQKKPGDPYSFDKKRG